VLAVVCQSAIRLGLSTVEQFTFSRPLPCAFEPVPYVQLKPQTHAIVAEKLVRDDRNSGIRYVLQLDSPSNHALQAALTVINNIAQASFFDLLRTKEELGR